MKPRERKNSLVSLEGTRELKTVKDLERIYSENGAEIKLLPLRKYALIGNKYTVLLYHAVKFEFDSERDAIQFLYDSSCKLSGLFHLLNKYYLQLITISQPGAFKLSHRDYSKYNSIRTGIDKMFYFTAYLYAGQTNHVFYKNTVFILEELLNLISTLRKVPGINQEIDSLEAAIKEPLLRIEAAKDSRFNEVIHNLNMGKNGFGKRLHKL